MINIQLQSEDIERRVKDYKNDPFIKTCQKYINRILDYSKPHIMVCLDDNSKSVFDIDEDSKKAIEVWKERIKEYVKTNYSDIIK